jgi:two-component system, OmpR family, sensor histidine kinase BaeS
MTGGDDRWARRHGPRPPWWPSDQPWPPRGRTFIRERSRSRFMRRTGWYSFFPIFALVWLVTWAFRSSAILLLGAAFAAAVAMALRRMSGPVADIVSAAERIKQRDFSVRVPVPEFGPRWLGNTARAFNAMATELDAQEQARRHLIADIAHELRTPLTIVQGKLEGLIDGVYPRDDERLQGVLDDTRLLGRLIEDLRVLSTAEAGALALSNEPTDIVALARDVVGSLAATAASAEVTLRVDAPERELDSVSVDPVRIREVLVNLVGNALRYTSSGGTIRVTIESARGEVTVRVIDTGTGIAPADLPHIFDRFYKGAHSSGSGLGLTIAKNLVEAHGGTIRADSRLGAGTTIAFALPITSNS